MLDNKIFEQDAPTIDGCAATLLVSLMEGN